MWDALERGECEPHGQPYDFRARCPGHRGDNVTALHVWVGADGRAVLWCHAHQCSAKVITAALGLTVPDLFPAGHRNARRRRLLEARRSDFTGSTRTVVNVLKAVDELGGDWFLELRVDCPYCGSPAALLQASDRGVVLSCPGDATAEALGYTACTLEQVMEALAGAVEARRDAS